MLLGTLSLVSEAKVDFESGKVTLVRYGEILDGSGPIDSFVVEVGYHHESGEAIIEDDDVKVSEKVVAKLDEKGYRVVPNPNMPQLATFKPEEVTVMAGAYQVERKEK